MEKRNGKPAVKWIYNNCKKFIPSLIIISVVSAFASLQTVFLALVSKSVLEIATGDKQGSILQASAILVLLVVFEIICSATDSYLKTRVSGKLTTHLRESFFGSISAKKYSEISKYHSGDLLNRFTSDVEVLQSGFVNIIPSALSMITKIIASIVSMIVLEPKISAIVILFGVLMPVLARVLSNRFKFLHKETQRTEGETRSFVQECFSNLPVLKTFKFDSLISAKVYALLQNNYKLKMKRSVIGIFMHLGLYAIFTVAYYGALIWGAVQIAKPESAMTYGTLLAIIQLISQLRFPLQHISGILPRYYSAVASAERLMEIENIQSQSPKLSQEEFDKAVCEFSYICAENLSFAYGDDEIISDLSFNINRGQMVSLFGDSGSGKTTIFRLLLGLYEAQGGRLTLNGVIDIDTSLTGMFAYVPQGNMIISGSIKDNLTLGKPDADMDKIIAAAKNAEIYDFICSLENGFDTLLSEKGLGISEGQLQRIAIARALLTDAPVLLLDEATSALDEPTEAKVLSNIKKLYDKTVILVTHRTANLKLCDEIISLK